MRLIRTLVPLTLVAVVVAGGCNRSSEKAKLDVPKDKLAAEVNDWQLTKEQFETFLRGLPEQQKKKFDTPEGRADLAKRLMQEEIAYEEAKKLDLAKKPDVKTQIDAATRTILVSAYLKDYVDSKATPTDEEVHQFYDTHQDLYTSLETIRAQQIFSKSKSKLDDLKERVEEGGEKFSTLATLYSEDGITKADGGDLGYFNPGGYIRGVGYSQTFQDAVAKMETGKIYGPIKWEQGYSLVRVNDRQPAKLRPYDEVRDEISARLAREKLDNVRETHFAEVEKKYNTHNYMQEAYDSIQRGPEELFQYAQNSDDPQQRIRAFQEIVDKFPKDSHAPEALFMVGFVYAEELHDYAMADHTFNALLAKYPESDMADTSKWMLKNLDKPLPKFQDLKDLNQQIEKQNKSD
jgi:peptidyl-prolyl cis-trans isomerase C